ncbi:MAG TPA: hypothetical protein VFE31_04840 [Opitutaceae bacterium]|jgi:hypothetical protein|nr:hypothetical protein [Opitutaceae bacterium]
MRFGALLQRRPLQHPSPPPRPDAMLSLGAFRYRDVLAEFGGPILRVEGGSYPIRGIPWYQANARLRADLSLKSTAALYSDADGSGTHPSPIIARHIAISEALERWAFYVTASGEDREKHGFDVEPSTTGMAAFPGLFARPARKRAFLEATERFCLRNWWEGRMAAHPIETDWPGVRAVVMHARAGGVAVIAFGATPEGAYAYGHAADESLGAAIERAIVEMARHENVVRAWRENGGSAPPPQIWERRALFFATPRGYEHFLRRVETPGPASAPGMDILTDGEVVGPWSRYACVWRVTVRPPSDRFWSDGEDYFFW